MLKVGAICKMQKKYYSTYKIQNSKFIDKDWGQLVNIELEIT